MIKSFQSVPSNSRPTRSMDRLTGTVSQSTVRRDRICSADRYIHRADLHRGPLECATGLGVEVYLDSRVIDVDYHAARLTVVGGRE